MRFGVGLVAVSALTMAVMLAVCATVIPRVMGWETVSISSGSMEPSIGVGDVLVAEPYRGQELRPGLVLLFDDPNGPGLMSHRLDSINDDGTLTTWGDANRNPDSTPITPDSVAAIGRIIVPVIGWPTLWAGSRNVSALLLALLVLSAVLYASRWGALQRFDPWRAHRTALPRPALAGEGIDGTPGPIHDLRFESTNEPIAEPVSVSVSVSAFDPVDSERWADAHRQETAAAEQWLAAMLGEPAQAAADAAALAIDMVRPLVGDTSSRTFRITRDRPSRHRLALLLGTGSAAIFAVVAMLAVSLAAFTSNTANAGNRFNAAAFNPPSNLQLSVSCPPTTPITFRAATTASGQGTSIVLAKPTGTTTGDTMLAHLVLRDDVALTAPSGWSLVRRSTGGPFSALYVRTATAGEPASYTWTAPSVRFAAGLGTWVNVSTVTPIEAQAGQSSNGSSIVAPSIAPAVPNTMLVTFWSIRGNEGVTIPTSMTRRWELNSSQSGANKHQVQTTAATEPFPGTGPTGTRTAVSPASEDHVGQMVALRPASGGAASVNAAWTATPSTLATGYKLQRWLGAAQQTEQTITPRTSVTATDTTVTTGLTYTYQLFAYFNTWTSAAINNTITVSTC